MSTKTRVLNVRVVGFSAPERQMLNSIFLLSVAPARQIGYKLWNPEAGVAPDMYLLDGDSDSAVASWQTSFTPKPELPRHEQSLTRATTGMTSQQPALSASMNAMAPMTAGQTLAG